MYHHHIHEAVDRTSKISDTLTNLLEDCLLSLEEISRKILPVIVKGSHSHIVGACIQISPLWGFVKLLKLTQNMQLNTLEEAERNFAKW